MGSTPVCVCHGDVFSSQAELEEVECTAPEELDMCKRALDPQGVCGGKKKPGKNTFQTDLKRKSWLSFWFPLQTNQKGIP